jgi:2-polyprenyl-3-methyl-5-hydroxy-6-metoxy-1,4-benzoquinol methylase
LLCSIFDDLCSAFSWKKYQMLNHAVQQIRLVDLSRKPTRETLQLLRMLTLDEFGELLLALPCNELPHLSEVLPGMAPDAVQKEWTGLSGVALLRQGVSFMNFVAASFAEFRGRSLRSVNVLDFGCGWGRLLRLLAFYNDPEFNFGCDAWKMSLERARANHVERIAAGLAQSDPCPETLPYAPATFDLVYAFSVFTHLSEGAAVACMRAIRKAIKPDGLAVITLRPAEFWDFNLKLPMAARRALRAAHEQHSIAFHAGADDSGRSDYGDTSIPLSIFAAKFPGWSILRAGVAMADGYQMLVVLRPA